jgi:Ca-activated chloride channel family protein
MARHHGLPTAAALLMLMLASPAHAATPAAQTGAWRAYESYRSGHYGEALKRYQQLGGYAGQMGAGAAAWRQQDFAAAERHFSAALLLAASPRERTDALYDLGNAQYGLGRWQVAVEAFHAVLAARPGDAKARFNLAQSEARLRQFGGHGLLHGDLRGRHGGLTEGRINPDEQQGGGVQELEASPDKPLIDREGKSALGARLEAGSAYARQAAREALRLESGLQKLARLRGQPKVLLQGLLLQDQPATPSATDLSPW